MFIRDPLQESKDNAQKSLFNRSILKKLFILVAQELEANRGKKQRKVPKRPKYDEEEPEEDEKGIFTETNRDKLAPPTPATPEKKSDTEIETKEELSAKFKYQKIKASAEKRKREYDRDCRMIHNGKHEFLY